MRIKREHGHSRCQDEHYRANIQARLKASVRYPDSGNPGRWSMGEASTTTAIPHFRDCACELASIHPMTYLVFESWTFAGACWQWYASVTCILSKRHRWQATQESIARDLDSIPCEHRAYIVARNPYISSYHWGQAEAVYRAYDAAHTVRQLRICLRNHLSHARAIGAFQTSCWHDALSTSRLSGHMERALTYAYVHIF